MNQPAQSRAIAQVKTPRELGQLLETPQYRAMFAQAIPGKILTPDRMIKLATTAANGNPALLNCSLPSLLAALLASAQLGLEPNSPLGQAYLIPFGEKVQFIIGYKGLISLAYRGGIVKRIQARAVNEGDNFSYSFGLRDELRHVPGGAGPLTHVYALAWLNGWDEPVWEVMTKAQVERVRDRSSGWQSAVKKGKTASNPWATDFEEMARKTVLRKLLKHLPLSAEVAQVVSQDERAESTSATFAIDETNGNELRLESAQDEPTEAAEGKVTIEAIQAAYDKAKAAVGPEKTDAAWDAITQAVAPADVAESDRAALLSNLKNLVA